MDPKILCLSIFIHFYLGVANANLEPINPTQVDYFFDKTFVCEDAEGLADYSIDIRTIDDEGRKVADIEVTLDEEMTGKWKFYLRIDNWENGGWNEDIYSDNIPLCEAIARYIPKAWEKIMVKVEPKIPLGCSVKPGHYKVADLSLTPTDVNFPVVLLGKYRVVARVVDDSDTDVACQVFIVEINQK